jgi:hypothetical protein
MSIETQHNTKNEDGVAMRDGDARKSNEVGEWEQMDDC